MAGDPDELSTPRLTNDTALPSVPSPAACKFAAVEEMKDQDKLVKKGRSCFLSCFDDSFLSFFFVRFLPVMAFFKS